MLLVNDKTYLPQTLRPYQDEGTTAVCKAWDSGDFAPLLAMATGGGKTTVIAEVLVRTVNPLQHRALIIGHTEEIVNQLHDRIANQYAGQLDGHFGEYYAPGLGIVMAEKDSPAARLVIATRQSLHPKRLKQLLKHGAFDKLIIDECHHAFGDNSYGAIVKELQKANPDLKVLGVTATPVRGDGKALGSIFTSICYEWLIPDGITDGYLVPVTRIRVGTRVDLSSVKNTAGDYSQNKLVSALDAANWRELAMQAYFEHVMGTGKRCLAFFPSVEMSRDFCSQLLDGGVAAAHIDAQTPKDERRKVLRDYSEGKVETICNMGVLTEGFDAPPTEIIFLARPTRSRTLFTQIVGRGLRPFPGKHQCLLVDLTVQDTRALEVGSLLGRMIKCKECLTEYYAGMSACPNCGNVPVRHRAGGEQGQPGETWLGSELVVNYEALFEKAFAAWHHGVDGFLSCTLSFEDGAMLIVPPLEDNYYRLVYVPKEKHKPISYIQRNEDLAALMMDADKEVGKRSQAIASKAATWREDVASSAQLNLLSKLSVTVPQGASKGLASQLITHALAVQRLLTHEVENTQL